MQIAVHPLVFDNGAVLAIPESGGLYRLPKAILRNSESLADAAKRALTNDTPVDGILCQFVGIYDAVNRIPAGRELAAVILVRSWRWRPESAGTLPSVCWLKDFSQEEFVYDQNIILTEQGIFAPLSACFTVQQLALKD